MFTPLLKMCCERERETYMYVGKNGEESVDRRKERGSAAAAASHISY